MTPYQPPTDISSPRRNYALFAGAGVVVGLGAGLLIGQIDFTSESTALIDAVSLCDVEDNASVQLGDEGQSLTMDGQGEETYGYGAELWEITCVLAAIEMPDSVSSRMQNTRALDGRQSAEWGEFAASWAYHPDDGLNVVIDVVDEN